MCSLLLFVLLLSVQTLIPCSHAIIINEPVGIAGYYDTLKATFSAPAPQFLNAQLVYAVPASGCSVPTNNVTGKIVLFDAGLCLQLTIAQNIKAAGGAAALSNFNSPSLINVMSSSTFESAGIPTYYISSSAVTILKPFLANGTYINATLGYKPSPEAHTNALLDFFAATGGSTSWRFGKAGQYNSWNTANGHPCQVWYGVLCHDLTGNVSGIVLTSNTLSGTIPSSIGNIETLRILQLTSNSVSGTVPESVWGLTTLRQIILTTNLLTGTISPSIGGNTRLNLLALDSNGFSGAIPSEIGSLTRLTSLLLNVNSFSGAVPDFSTLTGLTALNLANNKLSGTVPAGLDGLISLVTLDLSRNGFSGNLPDLSGITTLQTLDISYNFFTGPLPPLLGRLTSLTKLSVTNNTLSGVFPSISNLTKLATLDISRNKFSGNLGGSSVLPTSLTQLTASYNEFISIGSDFSGLKLLTFVDLSNNFLSSILVMQYLPRPAAADLLAGRNGLSTINLSHNLLKNVSLDVEMSITGFPSLTTLDLSYNALAGRLSYPYSPSLNPFLATLDLSNNPMTGTIPNDFGGLPALKSLKVQNTRLHRANSGALLPTFIVPDYTSTSINATGNFFCPSLTGHSAGLIVQVDNNYHDYLLCYCNAGFRRDPMSVQLRCIPCPNHFICPGGEFDQEAYYAAKFFPTPNVEAPVMMLTCPNCQNENSQNFSCLPGYTDRLCAKCEPGFYLRSSECYECSTGGGYILFAAVVVVVILAIVFFSLAFTKMGIFTQDTAENELQEIEAKKDLTPIPKYNAREKYCWGLVGKLSLYDSRAIFEIVINYAQTLSILSKYLPLSNSITGIIGALDIANITAGGFGVECIRSEFLETYARFLFSALQPAVIVAGFLFIFYLGSFILKAFKRDTMWWKNVCMRCMLVILDFLFFPIILSCIAIFSCTEDPVTQVSYITNSPYTQCNDIPIGIKVLMLILQLAILFVFAGLLIFFKVSKNKKSKMLILQRFGFFFHDFKSNWFFVGLVIMSRRLIFSLLNGLLAVESINLYFANCFIILMSLMFYYSFQPYKSKIDNYLEILAHVSLLLCYGVVYVSAVLKETTTLAGDFYISWNAVLFFVMLIIVVFSKVPSIADLISFLTCQFAQRKSATKISVWQADA